MAWAARNVWQFWDSFAVHSGETLQLKYSSDCSGGEAPLVALGAIRDALKNLLNINIKLDYLHGSEHPKTEGDGPRKFIMANFPPSVLYCCMHERLRWMDYGGGPVMSPSHCKGDQNKPWYNTGTNKHHCRSSASQVRSTIYCGGFVCKQNSMANRFRKTSGPPAPGSKDQDGESAQTYYTSVELIQKETPEKFCLENTSKAPFEETVADLRARLGQYYIKGFKLQVPLA